MAMLNNQMVIIAKIRAALGLNIGKDEETYLPANYGRYGNRSRLAQRVMRAECLYPDGLEDNYSQWGYLHISAIFSNKYGLLIFVQSPQVLFAKSSRGCVSKHWFLGFQIAIRWIDQSWIWDQKSYPLVNCHITMERSTVSNG